MEEGQRQEKDNVRFVVVIVFVCLFCLYFLTAFIFPFKKNLKRDDFLLVPISRLDVQSGLVDKSCCFL
jgi:uncharacterized membrane protein